MGTQTILVVEDERVVARDLQVMLQRLGYAVPTIAGTGADAIAKAAAIQPDLLLMDVRLRGVMDGIDAAERIHAQLDIPVVYLTAFVDDATRQRARQTAPYGYLVKPFDERTVQITIEMALERHTRDRQCRTREQRLATTLASIGDAVIATDADGRITFANLTAEQLLRRAQAELIGALVADVVVLCDTRTHAPIEHPVMAALRRAPGHLPDETLLAVHDGTAVIVEGSVAPISNPERSIQGAVMVFQERSERQPAEAAQRAHDRQAIEDQQTQRLRVLSGGIAHDFNNLLTVVLGHAELARFDIPDEHPTQESLARIAHAAQRAADLTCQLRAYAGDAPILLEPLDINVLVRQAVASLSIAPLNPDGIRAQLAPDLPLVEADAMQIHRVMQHLLINAAEAIGEASGIITITTEHRQLTSAALATAVVGADRRPGWYVALEVADTGGGMDEATLARIFDPFFSTKFIGRGLGLPAVLGIVRQHGGALTVQSAPGQGATFTIFLTGVPS
jgi:two-component system cell cycle sensor histidine kinase/response regulator CckA